MKSSLLLRKRVDVYKVWHLCKLAGFLYMGADIEDMLGAIMAAEDDLISAHRQHIEDNMASVRDEMNLLGDLDGSAAGG